MSLVGVDAGEGGGFADPAEDAENPVAADWVLREATLYNMPYQMTF